MQQRRDIASTLRLRCLVCYLTILTSVPLCCIAATIIATDREIKFSYPSLRMNEFELDFKLSSNKVLLHLCGRVTSTIPADEMLCRETDDPGLVELKVSSSCQAPMHTMPGFTSFSPAISADNSDHERAGTSDCRLPLA